MEPTKDNFEQFEQLVRSKSYAHLTLMEREVVAEFCSSEMEYYQIQLMMKQFKSNISSTVHNLKPAYNVYTRIQEVLHTKWNKTSYYLNSIFDSITSFLQIENYVLKTSLVAFSMVAMLWFSFQSETNSIPQNSDTIIIADSSYKNISFDSSFVKTTTLMP